MFFADHRPEVMRITLVPGFQCASGSGKLGYERFEDGLLDIDTLGPQAHLPAIQKGGPRNAFDCFLKLGIGAADRWNFAHESEADVATDDGTLTHSPLPCS